MTHDLQGNSDRRIVPPIHGVSVIILTYNEEQNIGPCLRALDWSDDVIIVDSFSQDETLAVARRMRPDVRIFENPFEDFGQQRNWALDQTSPKYEWVLFLDADEICDAACAGSIQRAAQDPRGAVGFYLSCRNYFLGRWIKRCTLYPSWQLRLLKLGRVRYRKEGHGQREVTDGRLEYLREPYDHYGFSKGIANWIARHNAYSTNEVDLIHRLRTEPLNLGELFQKDPVRRRRCLKKIAARVGFRPFLRGLYLYVWRRGFLDGKPGLIFCMLRVAHEIHITSKLAERKFLDGVEHEMSADKCSGRATAPSPSAFVQEGERRGAVS